MGKKRSIIGAAAFAAMLVIILDGNIAVQAAYDGMLLCIKTVIPSLFPFFVLSSLITGTYMGAPMKWLRPIGKITGIPAGMESILIPSFLGGYPVAAQAVAQTYRQGQLSKSEAERLLGFCNNAGPSFLFGMAASLFPHQAMAWMLWGIQICSALITARMFPSSGSNVQSPPYCPVSLPQALKNAMGAMAAVCGWVLLFRVLIGFLKHWILWILPVPVQAAVIGILELTNGCMGLSEVADLRLRFVMCSGLLTFGGCCVILQITSVTNGLSLQKFIQGKCLQTLLSILLASGAAYGKPLLFLIPAILFVVILRKNGSIPTGTGV